MDGDTDSALGSTPVGSDDAFLAKYQADGSVAWLRQFGSSLSDYAYAVGVDGNVAVAGETEGGLQGANKGYNDVFVAVYDGSGTRRCLRQFGTTATEYGYGVATDAMGSVIVTGYTDGSLGGTPGGNGDIFLAKDLP